MPWPSNGDYYGFKEDAIKSYAPPISGVYGIYNFNHHILIGHSNNLRKALLRHHSETKFRFRRLQPTGFTFEVCPTESKGFRAEELIWEYDPILQNDGSIGLAAWWRSWVTPRARNFHSAVETFKPAAIEAPKLDPIKAPGKPHTERARRVAMIMQCLPPVSPSRLLRSRFTSCWGRTRQSPRVGRDNRYRLHRESLRRRATTLEPLHCRPFPRPPGRRRAQPMRRSNL